MDRIEQKSKSALMNECVMFSLYVSPETCFISGAMTYAFMRWYTRYILVHQF